jgi:hypothetical protein
MFGIGILCLANGLISILRDIDIDYQKSSAVTGQVIYADIREIKTAGIRRSNYRLVFYFKLNNSKENFAIYHSDKAYQHFLSHIKPGDTIKVYFRPGGGDYNLNVYQVEKGKKIIASYSDFNKEISTKTGILLFLSVLIICISIFWYKKINLFKVMNSIVEPRPLIMRK